MFQRGWQDYVQLEQTMTLTIAVLAVSGVVLGAWYMLQLVQKVFFGPLKEPAHGQGEEHQDVADLSTREILALAPLVVFILWIGLKPDHFLPPLDRPVRTVMTGTEPLLFQRAAPQPVADSVPEPDAPQEIARVR